MTNARNKRHWSVSVIHTVRYMGVNTVQVFTAFLEKHKLNLTLASYTQLLQHPRRKMILVALVAIVGTLPLSCGKLKLMIMIFLGTLRLFLSS